MKKKLTKHTGPALAREKRNAKPKRKPLLACVVCGCTDALACAERCTWGQRWKNVCSGCENGSPYRTDRFYFPGEWIVLGPGKSVTAPTSILRGLTLPGFTQEEGEKIAAALNAAYALGARFGAHTGWEGIPGVGAPRERT